MTDTATVHPIESAETPSVQERAQSSYEGGYDERSKALANDPNAPSKAARGVGRSDAQADFVKAIRAGLLRRNR